jgi:putative integral membrane protein (TIGR02587 family)
VNAGLQASFLRSPPCGDFKEEGLNFVRAFAGAFIFAMPLLYTLEMWTIGVTIEIWKIQVLLVLTFLLNVIINYYSGFKEVPDWRGAFEQALEVMAVGIVGAAVILLVLDRISPGDPIKSMLGMIVIQAVPLSIGASVANSIFHLQDRGETGEEGSGFLNDVGATVVGGVLVSIGIAPTDEGTMLASDLDYIHLTAIVLLSLLLSYGIVFASGFDVGNGPGPFQRPVTETLLSYLVSLIVSGTVLYLLDAIDSGTPPQLALAMIVVLTLPATIGGAAGRLVI